MAYALRGLLHVRSRSHHLPNPKISRQKYSSYVKENRLLNWYETSSKDPSNMLLAVRRLVEYILDTDPTVKVARENANIGNH